MVESIGLTIFLCVCCSSVEEHGVGTVMTDVPEISKQSANLISPGHK